MSALRIGDRQLDSEQIVSALVQYKLLEPLVGQVLLDEMIQKVPLSEQELVRALSGSTATPEDFSAFVEQWCQQMGVTSAYFKGVVLREIRVEKFKQMAFAQQVESEFLRTKAEFDQVEYGLVQITNLALAQELFFHLRDDDADFETIASAYSLGPERQTGGRIGPVPLSSLPNEVATLFWGGQTGVFYGPIPVGDRFWIVRLERLMTASLTAAIRASLIDRLYNRWLQSQVTALVSQPGAVALQEPDRP